MKNCLLALVAVFVFALDARSQAEAQPQPQPPTEAQAQRAVVQAGGANISQNYVLGPGDIVEIAVLGHADFQTRGRISQDGSIQVPYLGSVAASDRTADELGVELAKALEAGGYFAKPVMKIDIVSFASRYVTVLGEVLTPGLIPIDRPYHLSEILARAGGAKEDAADYVVLRSEHGPERRLSINALATGDASEDPVVTPNDKIFIPKAEVFYISGQVHNPGAFPLETGMTLRMAIARGGGLTDLGTDHHVKVTGKDGEIRRVELGDKIQPGDVLVVGEKLF